jgi:hypothetical protein
MAKDGRKPRYNVVSMRMTDEEMASIQELMARTNQNASALMRHGFDLLMEQWLAEANDLPETQKQVA